MGTGTQREVRRVESSTVIVRVQTGEKMIILTCMWGSKTEKCSAIDNIDSLHYQFSSKIWGKVSFYLMRALVISLWHLEAADYLIHLDKRLPT